MKRGKKLKLAAENESARREIARRLKLGLPLAGLLAAATLCGCGESNNSPEKPIGKENTKNEIPDGRTDGIPVPYDVAKESVPSKDRNAENEMLTPGDATMGEPVPEYMLKEWKRCKDEKSSAAAGTGAEKEVRDR